MEKRLQCGLVLGAAGAVSAGGLVCFTLWRRKLRSFGHVLTPVPDQLAGVWSRAYIRRALPDGAMGPEQRQIKVRYLQAPSGHHIDLRVADGAPGAEGEDAFAGLTTVSGARVFWHPAWALPKPLPHSVPSTFLAVAAGSHVTEDWGDAVFAEDGSWREMGDGYEELWEPLARGGPYVVLLGKQSMFIAYAGYWALCRDTRGCLGGDAYFAFGSYDTGYHLELERSRGKPSGTYCDSWCAIIQDCQGRRSQSVQSLKGTNHEKMRQNWPHGLPFPDFLLRSAKRSTSATLLSSDTTS